MTNMKTEYNRRKTGMRANTLPELLVAMVLSGLVLFFAYEGTGLIRQRLATTGQSGEGWQLIHAHATVERLMRQADSIEILDRMILFHSGGIPADTFDTSNGSILYRKGGTAEMLFPGASIVSVSVIPEYDNMLAGMDILIAGYKGDTLKLSYHVLSAEYMTALAATH